MVALLFCETTFAFFSLVVNLGDPFIFFSLLGLTGFLCYRLRIWFFFLALVDEWEKEMRARWGHGEGVCYNGMGMGMEYKVVALLCLSCQQYIENVCMCETKTF